MGGFFKALASLIIFEKSILRFWLFVFLTTLTLLIVVSKPVEVSIFLEIVKNWGENIFQNGFRNNFF